MKRPLVLNSLFTSFLLTAFVFAAPNTAPLHLSFRDALNIASNKNPSLIMAEERVKQALERFYQARSSFFPQVSAIVSETRQTKNLETFGLKPAGSSSAIVGPFNVFDARLRLSQTLFDWAMVKRLESSGAAKDLSKSEEKKIKQDVLALVASLYIEAKRAEESVAFSKAFLRLAQARFRIANSNYRLGTGSEMDLKGAKTSLSEARFQWRSSVAKSTDKRLDLKAALGFSPSQSLELGYEAFTPTVSLPKSAALAQAVSVHPSTQTTKDALRVAQAQEGEAKAEYLPKVSGIADYGGSADQPNNAKASYSYGLQLNWTAFEGGQRNAKIAENQSAAREAKTQLNEVQNQQEIRILKAKEALKSSRSLRQAKEDNFRFYNSQTALMKQRKLNGTASELDVIRAMADEAEAKDERDETVAVGVLASVNLAHELGQMDQYVL